MSEFKFSCPNCHQNIQATSEYSGLQINCPSCQTPMVVPAAPDSPAPAPAPAPAGARLSKAAATPHVQSSASAAATFYAAQQTHRKESKTGLIVGVSLGACAIVAAIIFGPTLLKKFKHDDQAAAAAQAATNTPPPPPQLTTEEILQNVGDTYKGMADYSAQATTVSDLDMSALMPGRAGPMSINTTSSLQLGRTNNYRLEWEQNISGTTIKGAAWSSGKGNFVGYGPVAPSKVKTRQLALMPASSSFVLSGGIADVFFSDTNSLAAAVKDFTKTNGPSLNGVDCYVLVGEENHQTVLLWVNKSTFLINQIEVILGGTIIDEAELKKLPSAQRTAMMNLSKIKGTIIETYDNIRTNQNLVASSFESAFRPTVNPAAAAPSERPSSMAGKLANPRRNRAPPPQ
jgi:hypothetical protein